MGQAASAVETRAGRRRRQTRACLIDAARRLIAIRGSLEPVPINEITELADVAIGSFYNHFASKEQLFEAVVAETIEQHGELLDALEADIADPAHACSLGARLTVRMVDNDPVWGAFVVQTGHYIAQLESSLLHRLANSLESGFDSGRFKSTDRMTSLAVVGGAVLGTMIAKRLGVMPGNADSLMAQQLLELLGLPADEAREIANRPLPETPPWGGRDETAESVRDEPGQGSAAQ